MLQLGVQKERKSQLKALLIEHANLPLLKRSVLSNSYRNNAMPRVVPMYHEHPDPAKPKNKVLYTSLRTNIL